MSSLKKRGMYSRMGLCAGVVLGTMLLHAGPLDNAVLHGETDKARAIDYRVGEEMVFTLTLQNAEPFPEGVYRISWSRTGDDGKTESGVVPASREKPLVIRTRSSKPGFVRILANVIDAKGREMRRRFRGDTSTPEGKAALNAFEKGDARVFFDGGAGAGVTTLASVPEPADYDAFWAARKARLAKVPMNPEIKEWPSNDPEVRVFSFRVACAGPRPVTGHYTVPKKLGKYMGHIRFHGYGKHFIEKIPKSGPHDRISMFINAHGYELGREEEYYTEFYNSIKSNGCTFGMDSTWQNLSTDTAYFGWMTYRIMRALQFLKSLPEWDGVNLRASGGSMGGLQTAWAAGLDPDVTEAEPIIPWCCDMGGRRTLKRLCPSWGVDETVAMRYFDPVNMAKRFSPRCRVDISRAGLGDYCCPPTGVAVFYNNIPGPKRIHWVQGSTHGYVPSEPHQAFVVTNEPQRVGRLLCDFETPDAVTIQVAEDGSEGVARLGPTLANGTNALWVGEAPESVTEGFTRTRLHLPKKTRNWRGFDRLAFEAVNGNDLPVSFIVYLTDAHGTRAGRAAFRLEPLSSRLCEAPLTSAKVDLADVRIVELVMSGVRKKVGIVVDDFRLLKAAERIPTGPNGRLTGKTRAIAAYRAACAQDEIAAHEARCASEQRHQRAGIASFAAAHPDAVADGALVMQATAMNQLRPHCTDFDALKPATELAVRVARGEAEGVLLAIAPMSADLPLTDVELAVADFSGFPASAVRAEVVGYVNCTNVCHSMQAYYEKSSEHPCGYTRMLREAPLGWYADPILSHVSSVAHVAAGSVQAFYVRVTCPNEQPAGTYRGNLNLTWSRAGRRVSRQIPLSVRVNGFHVGKTSELPLLVNFTPFVQPLSLSMTPAQAKALEDDPHAPVNLWKRQREMWADMLSSYFIMPASIYAKPGADGHIADFDLITRTAAKGRLGWYSIGTWRMMMKDEQTWRKTCLEPLKKCYAEACAAGLEGLCVSYGCDETRPNTFKAMAQAAAIIKREIPGLRLATTAYDDDFGTGTPLKEIDIHIPHIDKFDAAKARAARAEGRQVWWYIADETAPLPDFFVEGALSEPRLVMGAMAQRVKPQGFLYYAIAKWNVSRPMGCEPFTTWNPAGICHDDSRAYDGDGVWAYCGPMGVPVPTLRLENFRDGIEDYNYAQILTRRYEAHADKADAWAREARRLLDVPASVMESITNYTDDPTTVYAWRNRMADLIDASTT